LTDYVHVCWQGVDADGLSYEEELCGGSEPRGVMLFGDSAGAHFHFPYQWMYAPALTQVSSTVSECCSVCLIFKSFFCLLIGLLEMV